MNFVAAKVGDPVDAIDTPALIIELDAFERNMQKMADLAASAGMRLRPHAKTHRSASVAHAQIARGAVGQCCQKVGEAEVLVHAGVRDVLVSNQVVDAGKLKRLAALARTAKITLCFDSLDAIHAASAAARAFQVELGGLVEIDVGQGRCGVQPRQAAVLALAIDQAPGLRFKGLQAYHGSAQHLHTHAEREQAIASAGSALRLALDGIALAGLTCEIIGGGGTGTFMFESQSGLWNELQCGSYLFMDGEYSSVQGADGGPYQEFEQSLFVLGSVMSNATPGRAILDAGLKSYTLEKGLPTVQSPDAVELIDASDEHGTLRLAPGAQLPLGTRVRLIPSHCDPTINLHDYFVCVRNNRVEAIWPISARGASS